MASGELEPFSPPILAALHEPDAYRRAEPDLDESRVEFVQTHISYVFLTRRRVYKFRKPVDLGFLDFSSRAERNADCLREVALNRRLAPSVYLGVAPLEVAGARVTIGLPGEELAAEGQAFEHCVVMRRLPAGCDALSLLRAGKLGPRHVDAVAELVAAFHARGRLGRPAPFTREEWLACIRRPIDANFALLGSEAGGLLDARRVREACERAAAFLAMHAERLERRRAEGLLVDGHGDLHLEHLWFEHEGEPPHAIDCVEFREDLRRIDAASDVAFLAMDLTYRDRSDLAERFLRRYANATGDFDLYRVVDFFLSYRAMVRAKVAALAARDEGIETAQREQARASAVRHLELGAAALERGGTGTLWLLAGTVGTGKTTVAERLADLLGGAVISSDVVRKRRAGLAPHARAGAAPGAGLYTEAARSAVYTEMLELAAPVVESGRDAVLDATFARAPWRALARTWAERRAARSVLVQTQADEASVRQRLAARAAAGRDASDAGPEHYETSRTEFEPPREWPADERLVVDTDARDWPERLARAVARRRA